MRSKSKNENPNQKELKITVKSTNQTLNFPFISELADKFPQFNNIFETEIVIDTIGEINDIFNFFYSITQTFYQLFEQPGNYNSFSEIVKSNQLSAILMFYANAHNSEDLSQIENILAFNYSELLNEPYTFSLLQLSINKHYCILAKAISQLGQDFPYSKFIKFFIQNCNQHLEIVSLLPLFCISNFNESDIDYLYENHEYFISYFNHNDLYSLYKENKRFQAKMKQLEESMQKIEQSKELLTNQILNKINELSGSLSTHIQSNSTIQRKQDHLAENLNQLKEEINIQNDETQNKILNYMNYRGKIMYQMPNHFNGILSILNRMDGVEIQHAADIYENYVATNIMDYSNQTDFRTLNNGSEVNNWFEFDFKENRIVLLSYEIKAPEQFVLVRQQQYICTPKSWTISASNDRTQWTDLDQKNERTELNAINAVGYFRCSNPSNRGFRYIRFIQTKAWGPENAQYDINISKFEIYGYLL